MARFSWKIVIQTGAIIIPIGHCATCGRCFLIFQQTDYKWSGQVYAFMVVAFTNPLAWMETTGLTATQSVALSNVIKAVKPHHPAILGGHVLPLGEEPSGASWTGLQSIIDKHNGYLLVIREQHAQSEYTLKLWGVEPSSTLCLTEIIRMEDKDVVISNRVEEMVQAEVDANDYVAFKLSAPFSFYSVSL